MPALRSRVAHPSSLGLNLEEKLVLNILGYQRPA